MLTNDADDERHPLALADDLVIIFFDQERPRLTLRYDGVTDPRSIAAAHFRDPQFYKKNRFTIKNYFRDQAIGGMMWAAQGFNWEIRPVAGGLPTGSTTVAVIDRIDGLDVLRCDAVGEAEDVIRRHFPGKSIRFWIDGEFLAGSRRDRLMSVEGVDKTIHWWICEVHA